jgi:hypothetical protein
MTRGMEKPESDATLRQSKGKYVARRKLFRSIFAGVAPVNACG